MKISLVKREELLAQLETSEERSDFLRRSIRLLPLVGGYPLNVKLTVCPCGAGPFSVRQFEQHVCKIKTGKGRWVRGVGL